MLNMMKKKSSNHKLFNILIKIFNSIFGYTDYEKDKISNKLNNIKYSEETDYTKNLKKYFDLNTGVNNDN